MHRAYFRQASFRHSRVPTCFHHIVGFFHSSMLGERKLAVTGDPGLETSSHRFPGVVNCKPLMK